MIILITSFFKNLRYFFNFRYKKINIKISQIEPIFVIKSLKDKKYQKLQKSIEKLSLVEGLIVTDTGGFKNGEKSFNLKNGHHRLHILKNLYGEDYYVKCYWRPLTKHEIDADIKVKKIKNDIEKSIHNLKNTHTFKKGKIYKILKK